MGTVTPINIDGELVDTIKQWLRQAKEGRLTSIAAIVVIDETLETEIVGDSSTLDNIAIVNLLSHQLMSDALNDDEE